MSTPFADLQKLHQTSPFIELFTLDTTAIGGAIFRFTNHPSATGTSLLFGGQTYMTLPILSEGWDFSSTGAPPKPTLTISNVSKTLLGDVISLGDLVGTKVTRTRTFAKYLDDGESPDPTKIIGPEVYIIEQKVGHNNEFIRWQLTSILDRFGMMLPRRQVLKDKGFPGVSRTRVTG